MNEKQWTRWIMQTARTWDDLSGMIHQTGVLFVDDDHRRMTEYALDLNLLIEKMNRDFDLDYIGKQAELLEGLYQYTVGHFGREEVLLERYQIESLGEQKTQHQKILNMLHGVSDDFNAGRITVSLDLKLAVLEWVVNHINGTDSGSFSLDSMQSAFMSATEWNDIAEVVRSTGLTEIDTDHKRIGECILSLCGLIDSSSDNGSEDGSLPKVQESIRALYECAREHFDRETAFMERMSIEGIEQQRTQHKAFLTSLETCRDRTGTGDTTLLSELRSTAVRWLVNHINQLDYTAFCQTNWVEKNFERAESSDDLEPLIAQTGIESVDRDHLAFAGIVLKLNRLIGGDTAHRDNLEQADQILGEMYEFAEQHFSREETIMQERSLAILPEHREEHHTLLKTIRNLRTNLREGRVGLSRNIKAMILQWWVNHTNGTDVLTFGEHSGERG